LRDFQRVFEGAENIQDPEHESYSRIYRFYLDIAPRAYELHEKWKRHQGFIGHRVPIFAALSAFVEKTPDRWTLVEPKSFTDEELIKTAVSVYRTVAHSDPQNMGKTHACYGQLLQLTEVYKKLSK
jgi:hypothetical protein